ncbi:hypothetical protein KQX54_019838 [Cotesia glomerata]|uniref:Uncharacterized protein n=1 Tax=Cotesia glomerata TaxID=32391 RepID=A0AAV7IYF9_COTGL|nr:hypothetical protein KQX54_019838 [Cotesia glomerata]
MTLIYKGASDKIVYLWFKSSLFRAVSGGRPGLSHPNPLKPVFRRCTGYKRTEQKEPEEGGEERKRGDTRTRGELGDLCTSLGAPREHESTK